MRINNEIIKSASRAFALLASGFLLGTAVLPRAMAQEPGSPDSAVLQEDPAIQEEAVTSPVPMRRDPCPVPVVEMAKTPDDLAKVQADIDRYTLCVERAQLLQRLNDLAIENQEKLTGGESGGLSSDNPGMMLAPGEFAAKRDEILGAGDLSGMMGESQPSSPEGWVILSVFGSSDGLQARLGQSNGELAQVRQGDTLYDGAVVQSITSTGVTLDVEGEKEVLKWVETSGVTEE